MLRLKGLLGKRQNAGQPQPLWSDQFRSSKKQQLDTVYRSQHEITFENQEMHHGDCLVKSEHSKIVGEEGVKRKSDWSSQLKESLG